MEGLTSVMLLIWIFVAIILFIIGLLGIVLDEKEMFPTKFMKISLFWPIIAICFSFVSTYKICKSIILEDE